jgi:hypothetical protein
MVNSSFRFDDPNNDDDDLKSSVCAWSSGVRGSELFVFKIMKAETSLAGADLGLLDHDVDS